MAAQRLLLPLAVATTVFMAPWMVLAQSAPAGVARAWAVQKPRGMPVESRQRMDRLIVKFRDDDSAKQFAQSAQSGADRVTALSTRLSQRPDAALRTTLLYLKSVSPHTHVARTNQALTRAELSALARTVAQDPGVEYAEVDERVYPHFVPNDPLFASQQWNLKSAVSQPGAANLPNAWGRSVAGVPLSGVGVTVAVLDSGYRPHADLVANIVPGYDFISPDGLNNFFTANDGDGRDSDPLDPGDWNTQSGECDVENSSWHGTHAAGIIGAVGNNNTGVIGVAYGANILPVRVLGVCGGFSSDTAAAIQWSAGLTVPGVPVNTRVAKVINMSFGRTGTCSQTYQAAITAARNMGSVIVVSTGNESARTITQPSNCSGVIAVTAHTTTGALADYANIGVGTTISAPGNGIYTTSNTGLTVPAADSYDARSGTSFAAPQVAGVVALLMQIKPGISPNEVHSHLVNSTRPFASGTLCATRVDCGAGLLDAFRAVYTLLQAQGVANAAPVLKAMPIQYVLPGASLQFTVAASDAEGDEVTFNSSGLPSGASFNAITGVFNWSKAQPAGDYTFVIQPTDGATLGSSVSVKISVTTAIPVEPVPVVPTPTPVSGGGGGGSLDWIDLMALALFGGSVLVRRGLPKPLRRQHPRQQDGQ